MTKEEETTLLRFNIFFSFLGINKTEFAKLINLHFKNVNRLFNNYNTLKSYIVEINELGCSIDWLISGKGPIIANNPQGRKLISESKYLTNEGYLKNQVLIQKILSWILFNYNSINNFNNKFDCPEIFILEVDEFSYNTIIPDKVFEVLKISGCNLKWLFSNDSSIFPYENNNNGNIP